MPNTRYILSVLVCFWCFHVTNVRSDVSTCEQTLNLTNHQLFGMANNASRCARTLNLTNHQLFGVANNASMCASTLNLTKHQFHQVAQLLSQCDTNLNFSENQAFELVLQIGAAQTNAKILVAKERRVKNNTTAVLAFIFSFLCVCVDTYLCHSLLNNCLKKMNEQYVPFYCSLYSAYVGCFHLLAYYLDGGWALFTQFHMIMGLSAMAVNVVHQQRFYSRSNILNNFENIGLARTSTHRNIAIGVEIMETRVQRLHIQCTEIAWCFVFISLLKFIFTWIFTWFFTWRIPDLQNELQLVILTQSLIVPVWICWQAQSNENFEWIHTWKASWKLTRSFVCAWLHAWYPLNDMVNITFWFAVWFMCVNESYIVLFLEQLWPLVRWLCVFIWSWITSVPWSSSWRDSPLFVAIVFFFLAFCSIFALFYFKLNQ